MFQNAYARADILNPVEGEQWYLADEERRRIRRHLEDYCGLDVSGRVEIVEALRRLVAEGLT